ncbi:unnamed protein product, partial [Leptidea sinapis]
MNTPKVIIIDPINEFNFGFFLLTYHETSMLAGEAADLKIQQLLQPIPIMCVEVQQYCLIGEITSCSDINTYFYFKYNLLHHAKGFEFYEHVVCLLFITNRKMLTGFLVTLLVVVHNSQSVLSSSLLCGRTKEVELGTNSSAGAALALTLVRPGPPTSASRAPCQLRLIAPDAAAFTMRLIDVKV